MVWFVGAAVYTYFFAMKCDDNVYHEHLYSPLLRLCGCVRPSHTKSTNDASHPHFPQSGPAIDSRLELWDRRSSKHVYSR